MQLYEVKTLRLKVFRSFRVYNYMKKGDRVDSFDPSSFVGSQKNRKRSKYLFNKLFWCLRRGLWFIHNPDFQFHLELPLHQPSLLKITCTYLQNKDTFVLGAKQIYCDKLIEVLNGHWKSQVKYVHKIIFKKKKRLLLTKHFIHFVVIFAYKGGYFGTTL